MDTAELIAQLRLQVPDFRVAGKFPVFQTQDYLISVGSAYPDGSNILVVTHAFLIKTILYLFHYAGIGSTPQIRNTDSFRLFYDNQTFKTE